MKKNVIRIISVVLLGCMLVTSIATITEKLKDRQVGEYRQFDAFYKQIPGTVDVLFAGSSRVHCNINPVALWENYGISSYLLGLNTQTVDTTYYALKEAFKYQHPIVTVVEVSQIDETPAEKAGLPAVFGMRYGLNYIESILERRDFESAMDDILVYPLYHSRYDMLDKKVYEDDAYPQYPITHGAGYKGAVEHHHIVPFDNYTDEYHEKGQLFDERTEMYFDRIVELCKENDSELIFTITPAVHKLNNIGVTDYFERHPELTFINTSDYYEYMKLDTQKDFIDEGHMNIYGSEKVGKFFGEYISDNYNVIDHRGDAKYYSWDENVKYHYQVMVDNALCEETGFGLYFDYFPNENYIVIVSLLDEYNSQFIGQADALSHVSCNEAAYNLGGTWVVDGTELIYAALGYEDENHKASADGDIKIGYSLDDLRESASKVRNDWHKDIGNKTFEIVDDENGVPCILIDNIDYSIYKDYGKTKVSKGIEVVVYDKLSCEVVDAVCFDAENSWAITRNK